MCGGDFLIYIAEKGDTLEKISLRNKIPVWKIIYDNQLDVPDRIIPGQAIVLLREGEREQQNRKLRIWGCAYPFIEPEILMQAFPALDGLFVYSYGFTFEGEIVPPREDDRWLADECRKRGVEPVLVLTPFSAGAFNNQLVKVITEHEAIQDRVIENLCRTAAEKGYRGVSIAFEYILPENREKFAYFISKVRDKMRKAGCRTYVCAAPKTSDRQKGLWAEGMDYKLVGRSADSVFLMNYEWGYAYGAPAAVSPADKIRKVLEYAVTRISGDRLIMGIPNYGYDWPMPYEKGMTRARKVGNAEAVRIAAENGAEIQFAQIARCPWFTYTESGQTHEVWFEDVRSIKDKIELAGEYGISGIGFWNLMRPFRPGWLMLEKQK